MMTFAECVQAAVMSEDFVQQWARLRGVTLPATPLERLIDEATGHHDSDIARLFLSDVYDLIWCRMTEAQSA